MVTVYHVIHNKVAAGGYMMRDHKMAMGHHVPCNKIDTDGHTVRRHRMATIYHLACWKIVGCYMVGV